MKIKIMIVYILLECYLAKKKLFLKKQIDNTFNKSRDFLIN